MLSARIDCIVMAEYYKSLKSTLWVMSAIDSMTMSAPLAE